MVDRTRPAVQRLTPRERDILQAYSDGYTSQEYADSHGISFHTVRKHRQNLLEKLRTKSIAEAVAIAYRAGKVA